MADQSAFDRNHIETTAVSETSGVLDQLNLPPAVTAFIRKNQRTIWIVVSIVVITVVTVALYDSYRTYRINKAVSALDAARIAEEGQQVELLQQVVDKYSSTPAALWARVELAKKAADKGEIPAAIDELQKVNSSITGKNPLKPLVLTRLAGLHEQKGDPDAAITLYQKLVEFAGFAPDAHYAMARVYVAMEKKPEAIAQYRKYLSLTEDADTGGQQDPMRARVEYMIQQLQ